MSKSKPGGQNADESCGMNEPFLKIVILFLILALGAATAAMPLCQPATAANRLLILSTVLAAPSKSASSICSLSSTSPPRGLGSPQAILPTLMLWTSSVMMRSAAPAPAAEWPAVPAQGGWAVTALKAITRAKVNAIKAIKVLMTPKRLAVVDSILRSSFGLKARYATASGRVRIK